MLQWFKTTTTEQNLLAEYLRFDTMNNIDKNSPVTFNQKQIKLIERIKTLLKTGLSRKISSKG